MTVALITIHIGFNAGSALQTIASCHALKKAGADDVVVVNYIPDRVTHKRYWSVARQDFKRLVRRTLYYPIYRYGENLFRGFLSKYCNLTRPIYNDDDFAAMLPAANLYVTGSDQVWNFIWNEGIDSHYFFEGIEGRKIAYASSIGADTLNKDELEFMKKNLSSYNALSVRETSAKTILHNIGLNSEVLIDPTFMLTAEEWKQYACRRIIDDDYLFVYTPYNIASEDEIYDCARSIAKEKGLKVVSMSTSVQNDRQADKTVKLAGPAHFLSLMQHSSHVVTNSFHGTAFALNFGKELNIFMPTKFSSRITDLLSMLNMAGAHSVNSADYPKIRDAVLLQRNKANIFLTDAINADIP